MENSKLTVCIPSFNRYQKAVKMALSLLRQINNFPVEVVIIDNGSSDDYASKIKEDGELKTFLEAGQLSVVRNVANIGMSANILRCFEINNSEWLWIVADDDELMPGAVDIVMGKLSQVPQDIGLIKFSSERSFPETDAYIIKDLQSFIAMNAKSADDFNGFIFISNLVFRRQTFLPYLSVGYEHAHTFVPHFMMMSAYHRDQRLSQVFQDNIVNYVTPDIGYSYSLVAGLGVGGTKFLKHNLSKEDAQDFYSLFFPHNDFKVIIDLYYICKFRLGQSAFLYFSRIYLDSLKNVRSLLKRVVLRGLLMLARFPMLFELLVLSTLKKVPLYKRHINEIEERYKSDV